MEYPFFQAPVLGNGMVIALNGVLHVVLSHGLAVGAFFLVALTEWAGWRRRTEGFEELARWTLKPTIIAITGVGAVTGVGIWFTTGTLATRGVAGMIRVFFWPWYIEWIVFVVEVAILVIYYYTWDHWSGPRKSRHVALGMSYGLAALVSAALITGILGFMLTPDGWPFDHGFWGAFFNPTFGSQLVFRLAESIVMGAIWMTVLLVFFSGRLYRPSALRLYGAFALAALLVEIGAAWWWLESVPRTYRSFAYLSVVTHHLSQLTHWFWWVQGGAVALVLVFGVVALARSRALARPLAVVAGVLAIAFAAEFERVREFIRGPYLMPGYMYVNQVLLEEKPYLSEQGFLQQAWWFNAVGSDHSTLAQGAYLFGRNCGMCHTIGGLNDIRDRLRGRSRDGIEVLVSRAHEMVPFMPPFAGTDDERVMTADFLYRLTQGELRVGTPARYFVEGRQELP